MMKKRIIAVLLVTTSVILLSSCSALLNNRNSSNSNKSNGTTENKTDNSTPSSPVKEDINSLREKSNVINLKFNTDGYTKLSANIIKEYGEDLIGEKVITSFVISGIDKDSLKASDGGLMYSLVCKFDSKDMKDLFKNDEKVTVAGIVEEVSFSAPRLKDCVVIGYGEDLDELESDTKTQKEYAEKVKKEHAELKEKELEEERENYSAQCEKIVYRDVERNPDTFKGTKIKISGEVIQVSEGFFDSVTLRVEDKDGNVWYVTYTRKDGESRILEDDKITCFGECDGVETYTSVLGGQVTIPSMKMKYYEIK